MKLFLSLVMIVSLNSCSSNTCKDSKYEEYSQSKIESRAKYIIGQSMNDKCMIYDEKCVFQNDSICIIDYIITNDDEKHRKEYVYYKSYIGELLTVLNLDKESSIPSFAKETKESIKDMPSGENLSLDDLIIYATMRISAHKGKQVIENKQK